MRQYGGSVLEADRHRTLLRPPSLQIRSSPQTISRIPHRSVRQQPPPSRVRVFSESEQQPQAPRSPFKATSSSWAPSPRHRQSHRYSPTHPLQRLNVEGVQNPSPLKG